MPLALSSVVDNERCLTTSFRLLYSETNHSKSDDTNAQHVVHMVALHHNNQICEPTHKPCGYRSLEVYKHKEIGYFRAIVTRDEGIDGETWEFFHAMI